jgi:hypothetical protein
MSSYPPNFSNELVPYKASDMLAGYHTIWSKDIHISAPRFELCSPGTTSIEEMSKGRRTMIPSDMISRIFEFDKETALTLAFMEACINSRMGEKIEPDTFAEIYEKVSAIAKKMADRMNENHKSYNRSIMVEKSRGPEPCDTPGPMMRVGSR